MCKSTNISQEEIKILALKDDTHRELPNDYGTLLQYNEWGWDIYATNKNGVYFFLANRDMDGADWCKITKHSS